MSKCERIANLLNRSGLLRFAEIIGFRPVLLVLAYHRIGTDAEHLFDDELISTTAEDFRAQIAYLRERFTVIGLEELLHLEANRPSTREAAMRCHLAANRPRTP